jgi:hypothetical protein
MRTSMRISGITRSKVRQIIGSDLFSGSLLSEESPRLPEPEGIVALPVDFNRLFDLERVVFIYGVPGAGKTRKLLELFNTTRGATVFITFTTSARSGAAERSESGRKAFLTLHSIALRAVARALDKPINEILPCVDEDLNPQPCTRDGKFDVEESMREIQRRICRRYGIPFLMTRTRRVLVINYSNTLIT